MRILVAALALVLLSVPAYSQGLAGKQMRAAAHNKAEKKKPKADEKAYQDALSRLPDKKRDPWAGAR